MLIFFEGIIALRSLRHEWQQDAGEHFPQAVLIELLVLRDICKKLDLNIFQCQDVLGEEGWGYVNAYINMPIGVPVEYPTAALNRYAPAATH